MANSGRPTDPQHTHLFRVPEPLEKLFGELEQLEKVADEPARADVERVRALIRDALAAQERGAVADAVEGITRAMHALATLAARIDPAEAKEMSAVADQFGRALRRGDSGDARNAAEEMRARAGAKVVKGD